MQYLTDSNLKAFIKAALKEDVGDGDHSTLASVPKSAKRRARLLIKDEGIIAGVDLAKRIFNHVDESLEINAIIEDGGRIAPGDVALTVSGSAQSILTSERLVLNCMQRMSAIATYTSKMVHIIGSSNAKLLDTRKTTPNFRMLEKWAVKIGGGHNHRFGLYDMIMLKDNHVDYAGGMKKAITATQKYLKKTDKKLRIEVEARTLEEVREIVSIGGVDIIMLDNMIPSQIEEALLIIDGDCLTEASGGITEKNIKEFALTGVDFVSVGALTHQVQSLDMSLKAY